MYFNIISTKNQKTWKNIQIKNCIEKDMIYNNKPKCKNKNLKTKNEEKILLKAHKTSFETNIWDVNLSKVEVFIINKAHEKIKYGIK